MSLFPYAILLGLSALTLTAHAVDIGDPAPGFSLPRVDSANLADLSLASQRGKVVYVDFWASWCAPCRYSMPLLDGLRNQLQSEGALFEVVAVNVDADVEDAKQFLNQYSVSYPLVSDPIGATPAAFDLQGMPTGYLVDANGNVRLIHQGFRPGDIESLEQAIRQLLSDAPH